jgi:hypothetical protein
MSIKYLMGIGLGAGLSLAVVFFPVAARAQTPSGSAAPEPAALVIKEACKDASGANKKVFLLFHASWCGWCRRMDSLMGDGVCKDLFDRYYVIRHLTILESPNKKNLENPGALDLYTKYAGSQNQGIPFFLIIDGDGTILADSRIKPDGAAPGSSGDNTGCPDKPDEVAYFVKVLQHTSGLSGDQLGVIAEQFSRKH